MKLTLPTLLILLFGVLTWRAITSGNQLLSTPPQPSADAIRYYVQDLRRERFDKQGNAVESLTIGTVTQRIGDTDAQIAQIQYERKDNANKDWTVTATHGALEQENTLRLFDGVELIYRDQNVTLRSPTLTIQMDQKIASSDDRILIASPDSETQGTGVLLDLDSSTAQLLADVETVYARR
jgi:LPS export ABC transporter protein LptC